MGCHSILSTFLLGAYCEESRCDSEDTSCQEHCELVEKTEKTVP